MAFPIFYAYLDTNVPDILYNRMMIEEQIDKWVEDFEELLREFENTHNNDNNLLEFEFVFYDRMGQLSVRAYTKDDSVKVDREEAESFTNWTIEELNKFLAEKDICKVPDYRDVMYWEHEFYIPYRWAGYSKKYDTLYIKDTLYTASDYEWEDEDDEY